MSHINPASSRTLPWGLLLVLSKPLYNHCNSREKVSQGHKVLCVQDMLDLF